MKFYASDGIVVFGGLILVVYTLAWWRNDHHGVTASVRAGGPALVAPSDHALVAVALLFANRRWGIVACVTAGLMALARVCVGAHYPVDVAAGSAPRPALALIDVRDV